MLYKNVSLSNDIIKRILESSLGHFPLVEVRRPNQVSSYVGRKTKRALTLVPWSHQPRWSWCHCQIQSREKRPSWDPAWDGRRARSFVWVFKGGGRLEEAYICAMTGSLDLTLYSLRTFVRLTLQCCIRHLFIGRTYPASCDHLVTTGS